MMNSRPHLQRLVERVRLLPPLPAAVVHAVDRDSLQLALSGAFAGYLAPTLVGPEQRIRDEANRAGLDITRLPLVDAADDPRSSAERAVELARRGDVHALVRGALSLDTMLMPVVVPDSGLRTARRLSYVQFLDLPMLSRPLIAADAMLNVAPNLAAKKDIVRNTIAFAHAIGLAAPNVALLAAKGTITPAFPSTSEAAALMSMAAQGAFPGATVEGPMTADIALSPEFARHAGTRSAVAGRADVLIAPTMEAAVMLVRALTGLTGGLAAGLVLGASVPIVVPGPQDPIETRVASCVLASLVSAALREAPATQAPRPIPAPVAA